MIDIEIHEQEVIEVGDYLLKIKPIVIIEVISEKVAEDLNKLIDLDQHVVFHLKGVFEAVPVDSFSYIPPHWNFILFHRDRVGKVKQETSLYENQ